MNSTPNKRLIVGISGASGVIYGIRLLEVLRRLGEFETHLVLTKPAERTITEETDWRIDDVKADAIDDPGRSRDADDEPFVGRWVHGMVASDKSSVGASSL